MQIATIAGGRRWRPHENSATPFKSMHYYCNKAQVKNCEKFIAE